MAALLLFDDLALPVFLSWVGWGLGHALQLCLAVVALARGVSQPLTVEECPLSLWEIAILRGYDVFRQVKGNLGGTIICDRTARTIEYKALEEIKP